MSLCTNIRPLGVYCPLGPKLSYFSRLCKYLGLFLQVSRPIAIVNDELVNTYYS